MVLTPLITLPDGRTFRVLDPGERHNRDALQQLVLWIGRFPVIEVTG